jgi:hypothetical protein
MNHEELRIWSLECAMKMFPGANEIDTLSAASRICAFVQYGEIISMRTVEMGRRGFSSGEANIKA